MSKTGEFTRAFESLIDKSPVRVYVKNLKRQFVYVNSATRRALQRVNSRRVEGSRDENYFSGSHLEEARREELAILSGKGSEAAIDHSELETWKDGTLNIVVTRKEAWIDKDTNQIKGIVGISRVVELGAEDQALRQVVRGAAGSGGRMLGVYLEKLGDHPRRIKRISSKRIPREVWFDENFKKSFPQESCYGRFKRVFKEDRRKVTDFLNKARNAGNASAHTIEFRAQSGDKTLWVWAQAFVFSGADGDTKYMLVLHRDGREERFREMLSRRILEVFPGFVFVKDSNRRFRYMNPKLLNELGKNIGEVIGKTDNEMGFKQEEVALFDKGDHEVFQGHSPYYFTAEERLTPPGKNGPIELVTIKFKVQTRDLEPFEFSKEPCVIGFSWVVDPWWLGYYNRQLWWRTLLDKSSDAIYIKDSQGIYLDVNQAFADMLGMQIGDICGHGTGQVWGKYPSVLQAILGEDKQVIDSRRPLTDISRSWTKPDGSIEWQWQSYKLPIIGADGKVAKILGIARNVTAEKRAEFWRKFSPEIDVGLLNKPPTHREIAVIFCDIRGFSSIANDLQKFPHVLIDLLTGFMNVVADVSKENDFIVDKYFGDGAMLICEPKLGNDGLVSQEERQITARRATALSLSLTERFADRVKAWKIDHKFELLHDHEVRVGIGIHIGNATVGLMQGGGRMQYTAFGDTVNDARIYETIAGKLGVGHILVSPIVAKLIADDYITQAHTGIKLDKSPHPLNAYSVTARKPSK